MSTQYSIRFHKLAPLTSNDDLSALPTPAALADEASAVGHESRTMDLKNGERLVHCDREQDIALPHIIFGRTNYGNIPMVEQDRELTPLELAENAGVTKLAFCGLFGDGVVAVMTSAGGPTPVMIGRYLRSCVTSLQRRTLATLIDTQAVSELENLEEITLLETKIHTSEAALLREHDHSIAEMLEACSNDYGAFYLGLSLHVEPRSRDQTLDTDNIPELAKRLQEHVVEGHDIQKLKVNGRMESGQAATGPISLLSHMLQTSIKVDMTGPGGKERIGDLNSTAAFSYIEDAYEAYQEDIRNGRYAIA